MLGYIGGNHGGQRQQQLCEKICIFLWQIVRHPHKYLMFPSSKIFLIRERVYRLCTVTNTGIVSILPVHELRLGLGLGFHLPCIQYLPYWQQVHAQCKVCIPIGNTKLRDGGTMLRGQVRYRDCKMNQFKKTNLENTATSPVGTHKLIPNSNPIP